MPNYMVTYRVQDKKLADNHKTRHANVFVVDEVGSLRSSYPIESMQSSQMNMENRMGILISTAYESLDNPMIAEVNYAEQVLDGLYSDTEMSANETLFALIYKPDDPDKWMEDEALYQANPLVYDVPDNLDYLKDRREEALHIESKKSNFLTKHLNIFTDGSEVDRYIDVQDLRKGCLDSEYEWHGKEVYVGVDLSQTTDNTAVVMVHYDRIKDKFYSKAWAFLPEWNIDEKNEAEKIDYYQQARNGNCFVCGDRVIDYSFIEQFVIELPQKYGVIIRGIGYDRYNAISSAQKWGAKGIPTVEVRQHSSALHPATKMLKESVLEEQFFYEKNSLYEINFSNAREVKDTNLNIYVNKKKSAGRVDMVVATINAMFLWHVEVKENRESVYENRGIISL